MSHKDAPPETPEQQRMAAFYTQRGVVCGWGRDKGGNYLAQFARDAWAAWQAAKAENAPDWFPSSTAKADTYASYKEQRDGAVQAALLRTADSAAVIEITCTCPLMGANDETCPTHGELSGPMPKTYIDDDGFWKTTEPPDSAPAVQDLFLLENPRPEQHDEACACLDCLEPIAGSAGEMQLPPSPRCGQCNDTGLIPDSDDACQRCGADSASLYPCGQKCGRWPNCTCAHMSADERAALTVAPVSAVDVERSNYSTHTTRTSDSSLYDEVCTVCGAKDYAIGPDELTLRPCTAVTVAPVSAVEVQK